MNNGGIAYALIRATVEQSVLEIRRDPRRGLQNLLELGERHARRPLQKELLDIIRRQLRDENGALITLAERLFRGASTQALTNFAMNLGYHSLNRGREKARQVERREGFHIPWCLFFDMTDGISLVPSAVSLVIRQGRNLGIRCHFLLLADDYADPDGLLEVLAADGDGTYFLFLPSALVTTGRIRRLRTAGNILAALELGGEDTRTAAAASALVKGRCLWGGYAPCNSQPGHTEELLSRAADLRMPLLFLLEAEKGRHPGTGGGRCSVTPLREGLPHPVLPVELYRDLVLIGRAVGAGPWIATVSGDGSLTLADLEQGSLLTGYSLRELTLRKVLARALPKEDIQAAPQGGKA